MSASSQQGRPINLTMYTTREERIAYERNTYHWCDHGNRPESCKRCAEYESQQGKCFSGEQP